MREKTSALTSEPTRAPEGKVSSAVSSDCYSRSVKSNNLLSQSGNEQITAVDLFAGAGGFSLAAHNAGIKVLAAVENDKHSCATYLYNFNSRMGLGIQLFKEDINVLTPERMMAETSGLANGCDLVIGGPPCQGFSSHRFKNKGVGDPRNELLIRYFEFVKALQPAAFLIENVPGLLWDRHKAYLVRFEKAAAGAGYQMFEPEVLNASDFGVPQRRRRVFLLGVAREFNLDIHWPPHQTHSKSGQNRNQSNRPPEWVKASHVFDVPLPKGDQNSVHMNHSEEMIERFRNTPPNGGSRAESGFTLRCHQEHNGHKDCYGRIDPSKPGPTMTTACINPSKGRFVHPTEHHGITLRHAARFQTFPDDFVFEGGLISGGGQIGNAVPVALGEILLGTINNSLRQLRQIF